MYYPIAYLLKIWFLMEMIFSIYFYLSFAQSQLEHENRQIIEVFKPWKKI